MVAAQTLGESSAFIMVREIMPNVMAPVLASAALQVAHAIVVEAGLSFLGLGLRPPVTSWGVLLSEAQNIEAVALYPWLMLPMLPVVITVLAFNFMGDGMRDAADPYTEL